MHCLNKEFIMVNDKSNSLRDAFDELIRAIQYRNDSQKGLLSMDSFLDIIGDFCDKEIEKTKSLGTKYIHGACIAEKSEEDSCYKFYIELVFEEQDGEVLSKNMILEKKFDEFTRETRNLFDCNSQIIYSIHDEE